MRDYALMRPRFWTQGTGRDLRGHKEAQIVALYLISSPHSNLIGLYYLPLSYLSHETGLTTAEVLKGFVKLGELDYAHYDEASEYVWVVNMAREQAGSSGKEGDKRAMGVSRELDRHRKSPFFYSFTDLYRGVFGLKHETIPPRRGMHTPPKGVQEASAALRWMERDQDQDQDQDRERECEGESTRDPEPESETQPLVAPEPTPAPAPAPPPLPKAPKETKTKRASCPMADDPAVAGWLLAHKLPALDSDNGREVEKFLNYHSGKGTLSARWVASWATWRGNWAKFGSQEPGPAQRFCGPPGELPPLKVKPPPPVFVHDDPNVPMPEGDQMIALLQHFDGERERLKAS